MTKKKKRDSQEVTRYIFRSVERELWARSAGRCQFSGCNRELFKSPVTQESVNISEKAHIYSFSKDGPRGWGPFISNKKALNEIGNLILVCHDCHSKIDKESDGGRYKAELLLKWKFEHEKRIHVVTGVDPSKKSQIILYGANIGKEKSPLIPQMANEALFPRWYPAEEKPIEVSMSWEGRDNDPDYWETEEKNLEQIFERKVQPLIFEGNHFSIFGLAPIPLLVKLGSLFTDKIQCQIYQLRREPEQTWEFSKEKIFTKFNIAPPSNFEGSPVLVISLSASIQETRVTEILGPKISIWKITIEKPDTDFLKTREQLSEFRKSSRSIMSMIAKNHKNSGLLAIFPAMPVSAAIELGRIRMPKADMPWKIYDENKGFKEALIIGGSEND